jgi:hypothetical protein
MAQKSVRNVFLFILSLPLGMVSCAKDSAAPWDNPDGSTNSPSGGAGAGGAGGGTENTGVSGYTGAANTGSGGTTVGTGPSGGAVANDANRGDVGTDWPAVEKAVWQNVAIVGGGFIPGIIYNTKKSGLVYARTDMGGAYRLDPPSGRWVPLLDWVGFDEWNLTGVESLATDPVDPKRLYIAAGTYTNEWTSMNGAILRSSDYGQTFERTDLPFKLGGNMPGRSMGERLAIDPNNNSILYFGARSGKGLWKSTDFGATWSQVTSFPATGTWADPDFPGQDPVGVVWVTFDPRSGSAGNASKKLYVGVADSKTAIYYSADGGTTWSALAGQPTAGFLPHHGVLSPSGILYIPYGDNGGPYGGKKGDVWKYDTNSAVWTMISPIPSSDTNNNYFAYGGLSVDAQKPNTLMVTALSSWWPDTFIFRSTDAGATWSRIWDWAGYPTRTFRYTQDISAAPWLDLGANPQPPEVAPKLGWMVGDIEIDPFDENRMMYGTGATLYGSANLMQWDTGGKITIAVKAQGIEETAVLDLVSPPTGAQLLSGLGDICGFRHDDVTKVPAKIMTTPTFTSTTGIDFAESTPNFVVRVGNVDADKGIKSIGLSYDGGANWYAPNSEPTHSGGGTVAVGADTNRIVWSPTGGVVNTSSDKGNSWTASSGIAPEGRVASDRVNPNKFYGYGGGKFHVSTDGGVTFVASNAKDLPAGKAYFKAMPGHEGDIWLAGGSKGGPYGLWHSTDSGATFTKLANVEEADVIGFGKAAPGKDYMALYANAKIAGVRGIFRSDDAGATWTRINDDKHQYGAANSAITGDPRVYGRVYLGTNGRGILYRDK